MLTQNSAAPNFSLPDQNGEIHQLSDHLGSWVVIYFYPKDDTPGCTTEACSFRDNWEAVKAKAVVYGISTDTSASHAKFVAKYQLPFPLLADSQKDMVKAYQVYAPKKFMGREFLGTHRVTYIVDPTGKIAKVYPAVKPAQHVAEILRDLTMLQS